MRFLVTGGCGFIGSHLIEALDRQGASVTVIDDLSTGREANIAGRSKRVRLHVAKAEDFPVSELRALDGVFHLAAQASVPVSIDHWYKSSACNLLSTLKVLEHCAKGRIPLVYASSSAVYGNLPRGVEAADIDLISPYAADKYACELYCSMALKLYSLPSYGLRFFNVYGPRQDPASPYSGVISIFVDRLLRGLPITVNGGHQTRDFIFVEDVVAGLLQAYRLLRKRPIAAVSNLLTGRSISINELVRILSGILGVEATCDYRPLPPGDPEVSSGAVETMRAELGLTPESFTSFSDGLSRTVEFMRGRLAKN